MIPSRDSTLAQVLAILVEMIYEAQPADARRPVLSPIAAAYGKVYDERRVDAPSFRHAAHEAMQHAIGMVLELSEPELRRVLRYRSCWSARDLALELHGDQIDQAGQPYIEHLDGVAGRGDDRVPYSDIVVSYLHDTLEDCSIDDPETGVRRKLNRDDLLDRGIDEDDVDAIELLTKPEGKVDRLEGESRSDWKLRDYLSKIERIGTADLPVHVRLRAARTKRRDNLNNLLESRAAMLSPERHDYYEEFLVPRYRASLRLLEDIIANLESEALVTGWMEEINEDEDRTERPGA